MGRAALPWIVIGALASSSCFLFKPKQPAPELTKDQELAREVTEIEYKGYALEEIDRVADRMNIRSQQGAFAGPEQLPETWAALDKVFAEAEKIHTDPESLGHLHWKRAYIEVSAGLDGHESLLRSLQADPNPELFSKVLRMGPEGFEGALAPLCVTLRPEIDGHPDIDRERFIDECIEWVGGDFSQLWEGAEQERANLQADKERLRVFYADLAALFLYGGECKYDSCHEWGWSGRMNTKVVAKCIGERECPFVGWEANTRDGIVNSRCGSPDCSQGGWKSQTPSGTWTAKCNDGDCSMHGWTLVHDKKKEGKYVVTCHGGERCFRNGYDVVAPDGTEFTCQCIRGECFTHGTRCDVKH